MRFAVMCLLIASPLFLASASTPVAPTSETADEALVRAKAEAQQASKRLAQLERDAAQAGSEASKLHARQIAAAAAIEEMEARISESDAKLRLARSRAALTERRLATRRAPLAALLAGLATMGRQPPILALADQSSVEEIVRVKALLDATMPVIQKRSAALQSELAQRKLFVEQADEARLALAADRRRLDDRRKRFAELEDEAADRASRLSGQAFGAGERVLASEETLAIAGSEATGRAAAFATASRLSQLDFAPPRPMIITPSWPR